MYEYDDISIYYTKYGNSDKYLLILPGWGDTRNTFNNIINLLKDTYTIYIIDYPGFGNSPILNKELSIYDYARLIFNFIKDKNIINPIIIAHSFGGRISSILLGNYKLNINKLILIDVAGIKRLNIKLLLKTRLYKILKKLTFLLPSSIKVKARDKLFKIFSSTDYCSIPNTMKKTFQNIIKEDLRDYYKNITCDTLIIWGEKDYDTPLKDGKYLNRIIKNSALIIYRNAGHFSYLNYPYLTNKILEKYLK